MKRNNLKIIAPVGVLLAAFGIAAVLAATRPSLAPDELRERAWLVTTAPISVGAIQPELRLFGEVVPGREVELRPLVAGQIVETGENFREGGIVSAGELLLSIDPFDYEAALAERRAQAAEAKARLAELHARHKQERDLLASAREQLVLQRKDLERAKELAKKGNVSGRVIDERTMQMSQMQQAVTTRVNNLAAEAARIAQQEAILERLRIGVQRAERDLANSRLTAPFSGYVREVGGELGKRVSPNDRIARLTDAENLEVRFVLSDAQFGRIIAADGDLGGRPVRIVWQVGGRALIFDGRIDRVGARIAAASGGVEIFAQIADTNALTPIRPGAFVEVYMPDRDYEAVARLPEAALFDRDKVYVVKDGRLVPRQVTVAAFDGDDILVAGELDEGDEVLTTRFARVGAGVRVTTEAAP